MRLKNKLQQKLDTLDLTLASIEALLQTPFGLSEAGVDHKGLKDRLESLRASSEVLAQKVARL